MNPAFRPTVLELANSIFLRRIWRANDEAERILARHARQDNLQHGVVVKDHHVWPQALPDVPQWRQEPPAKPGRYRWRNGPQWEEAPRTVCTQGKTWSWRFRQDVDAIRVGGEWFY